MTKREFFPGADLNNTSAQVSDAMHQRAWDLIRQMRGHLVDEGLISAREYAWLTLEAPGSSDGAGDGSPAPRRIETYDEVKVRAARCDELEAEVARLRALTPAPKGVDLVAHLVRQRAFSERTFGPGARTAGVIDHIRKELAEIEKSPRDLFEWIDVVLLAFDGAWRAGHQPNDIAHALLAKQEKNERRTWPDWRTAEPGKAITHIKDGEQ